MNDVVIGLIIVFVLVGLGIGINHIFEVRHARWMSGP